MATSLLDTADKVPSLCLEQEFAPGEGLGGLVAAGLGCWRTLPASLVPPSALRRAAGAECQALAGKAVLETASVEHQGRNSKNAIPGGPHPQDLTPPPVPSPRSGLQGPYLGNHLACSVQGSSPCSQLCRPP